MRRKFLQIVEPKYESGGNAMIHTVEGVICEDGTVRLLEAVRITGSHRTLVTILDEEPAIGPDETARLSEPALADWSRPEEDAAWAHLQSKK